MAVLHPGPHLLRIRVEVVEVLLKPEILMGKVLEETALLLLLREHLLHMLEVVQPVGPEPHLLYREALVVAAPGVQIL
jgi:hypothetical protein